MNAWQTVLSDVTFVVAAAVVLVLAVTLVLTAGSLRASRRLARQLADGLNAVDGNTTSLSTQLPAINGSLQQIVDGLTSVDNHLAGAARAFGTQRRS